MKRRGRRTKQVGRTTLLFLIALGLAVLLWYYFNIKNEETSIPNTISTETQTQTTTLPEAGMETGEIPDLP